MIEMVPHYRLARCFSRFVLQFVEVTYYYSS